MLKRKFNPAYLVVLLLLPLFYILPKQEPIQKPLTNIPDYFWFSVKTTCPVTLSMSDENNHLASWQIGTGGFKMCDYTGTIDKGEILKINIEGLGANDTLSFLSFNVFRQNMVRSLYSVLHSGELCYNAVVTEQRGYVDVQAESPSKPVVLQLRAPVGWQISDPQARLLLWTELLFVLLIVFLHVLNPSGRIVVFSTLIAASVLLLSKAMLVPEGARFSLKSDAKMLSGNIFYNHHPQFTHLKNYYKLFPDKTFNFSTQSPSDIFVRFDTDGTASHKHLKIGVSFGLLNASWALENVEPKNLILNDFDVSDGVFTVTGPDPYLALTSSYFIGTIEWLSLLHQKIPLWAALIVLVLLVLTDKWLSKRIGLTFRPAYLLFLTIPIAYYFLHHYNVSQHEVKVKQKDYFYTSVKASKPVVLTLLAGTDSLTSFLINTQGFRYIEYAHNRGDSTGYSLRIENPVAGDTIAFAAFNFFGNNRLYSLYDRTYPYCGTEHAASFVENSIFKVVPQLTGERVYVNLAPPIYWEKAPPDNSAPYLVAALFVLVFTLVLIWAPASRYFALSCVLTLVLLGIFSIQGEDIQENVIMSTSTPQRSIETYYSKTPHFNSSDKFPTKIFRTYFRSHVELGKHRFIRCDADYEHKELKDLIIKVKTGCFGPAWDFSRIETGKMVLNDVDLKGNKFIIYGNDPFFALTSTYFAAPVSQLLAHRRNAFLFIALLIFALLVVLHSPASQIKAYNLFAVVLFLAFIANSLLFNPFNSGRVRLKAEKRNTERVPKWHEHNLKSYARQWGQHLSDNLNGRNKIILLNNFLYFKTFGQLINNPDIYFGKDGWMFYVGALGRELFENRHPFTVDEMQKTTDLFVERRDWLKKQGIKFYIFFPRVSQFIYEEMLGPRMVRHNTPSKLEQLVQYMKSHSDLDIIDVATPILRAKDSIKTDLYHRNDSHWNYQGTYFAYDTIINYLRRDFPEIEPPIPYNDIRWVWSEDYKGDLADYAALTGYVIRAQFIPLHKKLCELEPDFSTGEDNFERITTQPSNPNMPSMLMFRDSYAKYLVPYMGHHFSKSTYIWTYTFNKEVIHQHKPKIVLWQMSERFIYTFPIKNQPFFETDVLTEHFNNTGFKIKNSSSVTFRELWISTRRELNNTAK